MPAKAARTRVLLGSLGTAELQDAHLYRPESEAPLTSLCGKMTWDEEGREVSFGMIHVHTPRPLPGAGGLGSPFRMMTPWVLIRSLYLFPLLWSTCWVHFFQSHLFIEGPVGSLMSSRGWPPRYTSGSCLAASSCLCFEQSGRGLWQRSFENTTIRSWTPSHPLPSDQCLPLMTFFSSAGQSNTLTDGDPGSPSIG